MEWREEYKQKLMTAAEAVKIVKSGDRVYTGTASSVAYELVQALWERKEELEEVKILSSQAFEPSLLYNTFDDNPFAFSTYFVGVNERKVKRAGLPFEFTSVHLSQIDLWINNNARPDVAFFEVSLPDENGYMSFGASGVALHEEIKKVSKKIILQVNSKVPCTLGEHNLIHISEADAVVEMDREIMSYETPEADDKARELSKHILEKIEDGSTIQLGLGNISTAIGYGLKEKNDLGIHTELFNQPMLDLIENGNVTNKYKGFMDGKSVYSFALGTSSFYKALDKNPDFYCVPFTYANDPRVIAKNKKMISINSTMSLDLYGQAASECLGWNQQSGTGGQLDFVRGAQWSEGGKSFIVMTASFIKNGKKISRIVPSFAAGSVVTTPRADIQYVATEYGCVNLKELTMKDRARALISLADPDFRELLTDEAKKNGLW